MFVSDRRAPDDGQGSLIGPGGAASSSPEGEAVSGESPPPPAGKITRGSPEQKLDSSVSSMLMLTGAAWSNVAVALLVGGAGGS